MKDFEQNIGKTPEQEQPFEVKNDGCPFCVNFSPESGTSLF